MPYYDISTTTNIPNFPNTPITAQSEWPQVAYESFESLHSSTFVASSMH